MPKIENTSANVLEMLKRGGSVDQVIEKVENFKVELEGIKYYGDSNIIPSDESYFTVNETGETITGLTTTGKTQTELVIPYKINGKEITNLSSDQSILSGNNVITKVVIPSSITSIGMYAFLERSSLISINIPNSVTSIGDNAFTNCTSLTTINIPTSVTSIGTEAFSGCTSLKSINIPNSVTSIGVYTFSRCTSLTSINIPNSVTNIGRYAFENCTSLNSINIPDSVTSIGDYTFDGCTNLTIYCEQGSYAETYANTNSIPVIYTDISATDFNNKADKATTLSGYGITDAYTKSEIDSKISNVYEIKGSSTIANLPTNPEIGDVYNITDSGTIAGTEIVLSAGDNIVYTSEGWDKLAATVDLSGYATEIELERIKYYGDKDIVPSDESYFTVTETGETITGLTEAGKTQTELVIPYRINGKEITNLYSGIGMYQSILSGNNVVTKVVIPNSVTSIGEYAFLDCRSLVSINIPHSVTSIGDGAFSRCRLTSIEIPNSVTSISGDVFNGCTSLKSINIPNSVVSIGNYVFNGCTSLTKIEIPNSVTSIGEGAFDGCTNLTIYCEQGSYAETYAKNNSIPIVYTDIKDIVTKEELRPTPITSTTTAITANNSYNYGEQTELSITFPTTANDGDVVYITFTSGATATVLILDTTNTSDIELIPEVNTGYEVYAKYNGTIWIVNYSEYTVTAEAGA